LNHVDRRFDSAQDRAFVDNFRQKLKRNEDAFRCSKLGPYLMPAVVAFAIATTFTIEERNPGALVAVFVVFGLPLMFRTIRESATAPPQTYAILHTGRDPRLYGILAVFALNGDPTGQNVARRNLMRILDRVRQEYSELLKQEEINSLWMLLLRPNDTALTVALLRAIQRTNDTRFLPAVRTLVVNNCQPSSSRRVNTAAVECAAALDRYAEQARERGVLLRSANSTPDSALLRPAASSPPHQDECLLHTVENE
jgi:hypothetical protein